MGIGQKNWLRDGQSDDAGVSSFHLGENLGVGIALDGLGGGGVLIHRGGLACVDDLQLTAVGHIDLQRAVEGRAVHIQADSGKGAKFSASDGDVVLVFTQFTQLNLTAVDVLQDRLRRLRT